MNECPNTATSSAPLQSDTDVDHTSPEDLSEGEGVIEFSDAQRPVQPAVGSSTRARLHVTKGIQSVAESQALRDKMTMKLDDRQRITSHSSHRHSSG